MRRLQVPGVRWAASLLGCVLLAVVLWLVGPLVAVADVRPLESVVARSAAAAAILGAWVAALVLSRLRRRRNARALAAGMTAADEAPRLADGAGDAAASAAEIAVLRRDMDAALQKLARRRRGAPYDLPWYVLIGPPGSGKTTALLNAGLRFPLAEKTGRASLRGVGGTRNCDWWFTDEAVLLDTAGRYTTQDSNAAVDAGAWLGFLDMLKRVRPRQPLNGAIVAISLAELAGQDAATIDAHAAAIRARLAQLNERLGLRLPIYVVFTKADLVAGFSEFFADLGKEQREQVWGVTLPLSGSGEPGESHEPGEPGEPVEDRLRREFDALLARLHERLLGRLEAETSADRRARIFGFPAQVASLRDTMADFVGTVFQPSSFEQPLLLRGVYLTSATQQGSPIDRLVMGLGQLFGVPKVPVQEEPGGGRSYFLARLLREVVFAEAGLVGRDPRLERRTAWTRRAAWAAAALVVVFGTGAWWLGYTGNAALIERAEAAADDYRALAAATPASPRTNGDLGPALLLLDRLRALPTGVGERDAPVPVGMGLGLYQGDKLAPAAESAYRRGLSHLLLPQLVLRLEAQLRAVATRPDLLYEGFKVYLMLTGAGPLDQAAVRRWMQADWASALPGAEGEGIRRSLEAHLDSLLERPLAPVPADEGLVRQARATLSRHSPAERAYVLLLEAAGEAAPPEWRIQDHAGPAAGQVFARRSGQPLGAGLPGLFTHAGFHGAILPALPGIARAAAAESWVTGAAAGDPARLQQEILALYYNDFSRRWDGLLGDLTLVRFRTVEEAAAVLNAASGPLSPLRLLVQAAARETDLARPPTPAAETVAPAAASAASATSGAPALAAAARRIEQVAGLLAGRTGPPPGQPVSDRYAEFRAFALGRAGGPAGIDQTVASLDALYQQVGRAAGLPGQGGPDDAGAARLAQQLAATAARLPDPVKGWIGGLGDQASAAALDGLRTRVNAEWRSAVLPSCERALPGRFPVQGTARADMAVDDFSRLFAPGGLLDSFFVERLKAYVDTSQEAWRWQRAGGLDIGIPDAALAPFQNAATIREAFFPTGQRRPDIRFSVAAVQLDPRIERAELEIDGQLASFGPGANRPAILQWPSPAATNRSSLMVQPAGGQPVVLQAEGAWSPFKLLRAARIERRPDGERVLATFRPGGLEAKFELRASGIVNPFALTELEAFRCPPSL
ncbi:type VI secretion system membrane subunit TssM [Arenibaculum pallidiluteum]|uniref:type VI secretion system membrane subunit TssM n=1 Tax=Arenibaculum pallidiluteum TaxID=2812559 RepID=UPI001A95C526|nr:type VI secretion system membrane subunit TssM [Arenibaculum pallidiluteum]